MGECQTSGNLAYTVRCIGTVEPVEAEPNQQHNTLPDRQAVTQLLQQIGYGDKEAFDQLMPVVYGQLRKLAARCLAAEGTGHTLRATALVHEAYLQLVDAQVAWQDRVHFYSVAARVMRHILVDHAKAQKRQKRGGAWSTSHWTKR